MATACAAYGNVDVTAGTWAPGYIGMFVKFFSIEPAHLGASVSALTELFAFFHEKRKRDKNLPVYIAAIHSPEPKDGEAARGIAMEHRSPPQRHCKDTQRQGQDPNPEGRTPQGQHPGQGWSIRFA